jgi:O-antigen ligase
MSSDEGPWTVVRGAVVTIAPRLTGMRGSLALRSLKLAAVVALAAVVGLELHNVPHLSVAAWLAAAPALVAFGFVVRQGPRWCLAGLLVSAITGLYKNSWAVGQVDLRISDLFYVALVVWVLVLRLERGPLRGRPIGQRWVGIWLAALGISLYPVLVSSLGLSTTPLIAWLRLVQTISLLWLIPYAIRTVEDVEFTLGVVALATTAEIGWAVAGALLHGNFVSRLQGSNGPNPTGLLAALLILMALHSPVPRRPLLRAGMLTIGITALLLTRSVGSITAVALTLGIFGLRYVPDRTRAHRAGLLRPASLIALLVLTFAVVGSLRPGNLPGSTAFQRSTTFDRTIIATGGLKLFADHPITGVGWANSPGTAEVGRISKSLRQEFGSNVSADQLPQGTFSDLHNFYVQVLAQAGLIGVIAFVAMAFALTRGIRSALQLVRSTPPLFACARCALLLLVAILIWWNDNALYGAQPETVLAVTFLGLLAAVPYVATTAPASQLAPPGVALE